MKSLEKIIKKDPYSLKKNKKEKLFKKYLSVLNNHHYDNCEQYKKLIDGFSSNKIKNFPMIPVKIFKLFDLMSIKKNKIVKKLVSSGTSGQEPSKIFLDKVNSNNQMKVLTKIIEVILGKKRLPMLIVDKKSTITSRSIFNARAAAIFGFSLFGKNYCYLINENNEIDYKSLNSFIEKFGKEKFVIFGFTSLVYEYLIEKMKNKNLDLSNAILLHGGGWKKLENQKITNSSFKNRLNLNLNLKNIHNYYGMVEQTGSIFTECKNGYFHTTIFSDIFIRDKNFEIQKFNKRGLIQLISLIPTSYPGHNILTEDIGEIKGEDTCNCGTSGKYFLVHGRAKEAEVRGCSDVR